MLQFVTYDKSPLTAVEQAQAALDGRCRWIELGACPDQASAAGELLPVCRDAEAFLTIDDNVELVDELKVHGVHLSSASREEVMAVRERLGAHAVIGVGCATEADALALKKLDIDYISLHVEDTPEAIAAFATLAARIAGELPGVHIVASGEFAAASLTPLVNAGAAGVAVSRTIACADDPKWVTEEYIAILNHAKGLG